MSQTKRISFDTVPPTSEERSALQNIIAQKHYNRRRLKNEFFENGRRLMKEIETYVFSRGRYWNKDHKNKIVSSSDIPKGKLVPRNVSEVKEEPAFVSEENTENIENPHSRGIENVISLPSGTTLRFPFKKFKIEGSSVVIEF